MNAEEFFTRLAEAIDAAPGSSKRAPARLKARVYSALVVEQAAREQAFALELEPCAVEALGPDPGAHRPLHLHIDVRE